MVEFTAKDVMALRERTGAGMMDCKKALTEAAGDADRAIDILREKGLDLPPDLYRPDELKEHLLRLWIAQAPGKEGSPC